MVDSAGVLTRPLCLSSHSNDLAVPVRHEQDTGVVENCLRNNVRASSVTVNWRKTEALCSNAARWRRATRDSSQTASGLPLFREMFHSSVCANSLEQFF